MTTRDRLRLARSRARSRFLASTFGVLVGVASTGGCDLIPRRVTEKDCDKWSTHIVDLVKKDVEDRLDNNCKKLDSDMKKAFKKSFSKAMDDATDQAATGCKKNLGTTYKPKDADCLMGAKLIKDLKKCDFKEGAFDKMDDGMDKLNDGMDKICGGTGASGDDDDKKTADDEGAAPKKKKKKKPENDD